MPLPNKRQSSPGKLARHHRPSFNIKNGFKLSVDRVGMRSPVFSIEEPYHNSKESAQLRHGIRIGPLSDHDNCRTRDYHVPYKSQGPPVMQDKAR